MAYFFVGPPASRGGETEAAEQISHLAPPPDAAKGEGGKMSAKRRREIPFSPSLCAKNIRESGKEIFPCQSRSEARDGGISKE